VAWLAVVGFGTRFVAKLLVSTLRLEFRPTPKAPLNSADVRVWTTGLVAEHALYVTAITLFTFHGISPRGGCGLGDDTSADVASNFVANSLAITPIVGVGNSDHWGQVIEAVLIARFAVSMERGQVAIPSAFVFHVVK
jgi:hypothetical protein